MEKVEFSDPGCLEQQILKTPIRKHSFSNAFFAGAGGRKGISGPQNPVIEDTSSCKHVYNVKLRERIVHDFIMTSVLTIKWQADEQSGRHPVNETVS